MTIRELCSNIENLFKTIRPQLTPVPPLLLMTGAVSRPGVSPMIIASNIIKRQNEAGAPFGENIDGSRNISEAMEVIRVEEIIKALKGDSKIEIVIPIGGLNAIGSGANAGGPVVVTSTNTTPISGYGIIR